MIGEKKKEFSLIHRLPMELVITSVQHGFKRSISLNTSMKSNEKKNVKYIPNNMFSLHT